MPDPYSLLVGALSLLLAAGYFGLDIGSVLVRPISTPTSLQERGYSSESFTRLVIQEVDNLHFAIGAEYLGTSVAGVPEDMKISVAGADFSLTQLSIVLGRKTGTIRFEFAGDVVERDGKLVLLLTGYAAGRRVFFSEEAGPTDAFMLVRQAAKDIISLTDPYGAMKLQFEADRATGDYSKTLAMIDDLLGEMPVQKHHLLYNIAGRAFEFSGQYEQAIAAFDKAIETDPRYPISYANLAIVMRRLGRTEEADKLDRTALQIDPHFFLFFRRAAEENRQAGVWGRCAANFARFLHYEQDDAKSYYDYSVCLKGMGKADESQKAMNRALVLDPQLTLLTAAPSGAPPATPSP